jgi:hypothetical protein
MAADALSGLWFAEDFAFVGLISEAPSGIAPLPDGGERLIRPTVCRGFCFCRPDKRSAIGHCAIAGWRRMPYPAYGSQVILLL